jgi:hypothetical protein
MLELYQFTCDSRKNQHIEDMFLGDIYMLSKCMYEDQVPENIEKVTKCAFKTFESLKTLELRPDWVPGTYVEMLDVFMDFFKHSSGWTETDDYSVINRWMARPGCFSFAFWRDESKDESKDE